jgi:hypothetical protein
LGECASQAEFKPWCRADESAGTSIIERIIIMRKYILLMFTLVVTALGGAALDPVCSNSPVPCVSSVESLVGHGYDVLTLKPTNVILPITYTGASQTPGDVPGLGTPVLCPAGAHCVTTNVQSYREFTATDTKSLKVGFSASVDIVLDQDDSDVIGTQVKTQVDSSQASIYSKKTKFRHMIEFRLNSSPSSFSATTAAFQADVQALPPWGNSSSYVAYKSFFESYGTRFASAVVFGLQYHLNARSLNCSFDVNFVAQFEANITEAANALITATVIDSSFKTTSSLKVTAEGGDTNLCTTIEGCKDSAFMNSGTPQNIVPVKITPVSLYTIVPEPYSTWLSESEVWYLNTFAAPVQKKRLGTCSSATIGRAQALSVVSLIGLVVLNLF